MNLFGSKRGQILNYIAVILFLFVFGIVIIIGYNIETNVIDAYNATGFYSPEMEAIGDRFLAAQLFFDNIIVILMALFIVGVGITSFRLPTRAAGFIVTIVMATFLGFISYFFNFIFVQIVSQPSLISFANAFPLTLIVCSNLHWVALTAMVVGSIALYAKKQTEADLVEQ